jgi:hypothetical protein
LERAEDAAVDATANVGRRVLHAVWRRHGGRGRAVLEAAVRDAAAQSGDPEAAAVLREHIRRAMREDAELLKELAALVPAAPAGPGAGTDGRAAATQRPSTAVGGEGATGRP